MRCQKCGADILDGKIYCGKCGAAIQMVPDYDPEDDFTIGDEPKKTEQASGSEEQRFLARPWWYRCRHGIAAVCLIVLGILAFWRSYHAVRPQETAVESEEPEGPEEPDLLAGPQFSIQPGTYEYSPALKLSHEERNNGLIYYTMDGSTPDEKSLVYNAPIMIGEGRTIIRAIFIRSDGTQSEEADGTYEVVFHYTDEPVFDIQGGTYSSGFYLTLTAAEGCKIYYTTNGKEPDLHSSLYQGRIYIPEGLTVLQAVAVDEEGVMSGIVEQIYDVSASPVPEEGVLDPLPEEEPVISE